MAWKEDAESSRKNAVMAHALGASHEADAADAEARGADDEMQGDPYNRKYRHDAAAEAHARAADMNRRAGNADKADEHDAASVKHYAASRDCSAEYNKSMSMGDQIAAEQKRLLSLKPRVGN